HRVHCNVLDGTREVPLIPNETVVVIRKPEFSTSAQQPVGFVRGIGLPVAGCFPRQSGEDSPGNAILWGASCLAARPSWHRPPGARPSWPLSSMRAGSPRSSRNNKGAPMRRGALVGCALVSLEQKLQSQLDLTRVLGGEACRSDVPKVHVIVSARIRDGGDAVSAKIRRIERGVVEDVEELTPELEVEPLAQLEVLEQGVVESSYAGAGNLAITPAQQGQIIRYRDATRRGSRPRLARLGEGGSVQECAVSVISSCGVGHGSV